MSSMPFRRRLPSALLLLAVAACGGSEPQGEPEAAPAAQPAPAAAPAATAATDVVRTADPAARGYTAADFPRVQEIAPGVHTYEAPRSFDDDVVATVSMFVVTDAGVLVADGQGSPQETMASSFPREWVTTIEQAEALQAAVSVPGHGFVDPPAVLAEELVAFRGAIQGIIVEVGHVFGEGAAVEEALGREMGDVDTWTRAQSLRESAIRRVYADLSGELVGG